MRQDEYKKWLDAQFFEDEPASPAVIEEPVLVAASHLVAEPAPEGRRFAPPVAPPIQAPAADSPVPPAATISQPAPSRPPSTPAARPAAADDELPDLEAYLPFLRRRAAEPVAEPPSPPEEPEAGVAVEPAQAEVQPASTDDTAPPSIAEPVAETAPAEETAPEPAQTADAAPTVASPAVSAVAAQPTSDADLGDGPAPIRRSRRTAPGPAQADLRPDDVWSLAPKHLKTLISMGSDEITQHSYRRSFKESRLELINRLLDPTLSLEETARLLNVCPTTVRRYTNRGLLTHLRTSGDQRRFRLSDVLAFLEARGQEPE